MPVRAVKETPATERFRRNATFVGFGVRTLRRGLIESAFITKASALRPARREG